MRTIFDIDHDMLPAAGEIERRENSASGTDVSRLPRHSLTGAGAGAGGSGAGDAVRPARERRSMAAGFVPFAATRGLGVTQEQVDRLCDAESL